MSETRNNPEKEPMPEKGGGGSGSGNSGGSSPDPTIGGALTGLTPVPDDK